jgi:RHS repeat-associated protein
MENDGTVLRAFVFAPGEIAPVLVVEPEAQHYFFHYDHLKRPRLVTDDSGTVVWRAWYEPFGLVHEETDPDGDGMAFEQPFRLPGQFEHDNSQVYYNRYRWYLPAHGIYNRLDPESLLKAQLGIPDDPILSELRWTYGRSAPLTESDPLGLASGGKLPSLLDAWEAYRKAWCSCMQGKEKTRDNKSFCCGNAKSACHKKCNTKYKMPWCLGAKAACNIHCNELQSTCKIYAQGNANTNWFGCAGEGE